MNTCYRHESIVIDNLSISTEIRNGGKKGLGGVGKINLDMLVLGSIKSIVFIHW